MRHWYLVIVLVFIVSVLVWKPSTTTNSNQPLLAHASTNIEQPRGSQASTTPESTLESAMFAFLASHPDPGVRDELPALIRVFQMRTNWDPKGISAGFLRYPDPRSGQVKSVLTMSVELFQQDTNRARAQLVVYHEFQHYLQWRDGTIPEETFLYVPWPDADLPRICKQKWYAEREAYQKECEFGRANGLLGQLDPREGLAHICAATEEQFVPVLKRILPLGDPSAKACTNTWNAI